jgi:hypothetical protein
MLTAGLWLKQGDAVIGQFLGGVACTFTNSPREQWDGILTEEFLGIEIISV